MMTIRVVFIVALAFSSLTIQSTLAWVAPMVRTPPHLYTRLLLAQQKRDDDGKPEKTGYQFGDLTRGFFKNTQKKVNEVTGKEKYEFGDLSRWADEKAKERVRKVKGIGDDSKEYSYQLGDVSRWASDFAREKAAHYAGKDGSDDYVFGDISRTIFAKVRSGEYQVDDVYLALRVLLVAGFSILPVANLLPIKLLLQLVELDLAKDVGGKLTGVLASSVDARVKEALTGNAEYQLGDVSKNKLKEVLSRFTGKESYEFGDISRALARGGTEPSQSDSKITQKLEHELPSEFSDWDQKFLTDQDQKRKENKFGDH